MKDVSFISEHEIIFTVPELAEYIHMSRKWIYERTCRNEIPHYKIGGSVRFRKSQIDKWFNEQEIPVVTNGG